LKNRSQKKKRAGGVAQDVGPEFKPQYCKKKRTRKKAVWKKETTGEARQAGNVRWAGWVGTRGSCRG
jgi:hypothetical protein